MLHCFHITVWWTQITFVGKPWAFFTLHDVSFRFQWWRQGRLQTGNFLKFLWWRQGGHRCISDISFRRQRNFLQTIALDHVLVIFAWWTQRRFPQGLFIESHWSIVFTHDAWDTFIFERCLSFAHLGLIHGLRLKVVHTWRRVNPSVPGLTTGTQCKNNGICMSWGLRWQLVAVAWDWTSQSW